MITLLSFGICKSYDKNEPIIDCAFDDALMLYNTASQVFDCDFSNEKSIAINNPNRQLFREMIENAICNQKKGDIIILFFSGHGINNDNNSLNFSLSDGVISSITLMDLLISHEARILILLDCCNSGAALHMTNVLNSFKKNNISIIASCSPLELSEFTQNNSKFTRILCKSLTNLSKTFVNITVNNLVSTMHNFGYDDIYVRVEEGSSDINLKIYDIYDSSQTFINVFLSRLKTNNNSLREVFWYALENSHIDLNTKIRLIESYHKDNFEGSWFVRRAIGSLISSFPEDNNEIKILHNLFLDSQNWMNKCIGLISTRYQNNAEINKKRMDILSNTKLPMDIIWLANLYYSDYFKETSLLSPNMLLTPWGIVDLYSRFSNEDARFYLYQHISDDNKKILNLHRELMNSHGTYKNNDLVSILYQGKVRDRLRKNDKDKWLHSILYGKWRDYKQIDLYDYFESHTDKQIQEDIKIVKDFPQIEAKMSILDFISFDEKLKEKYKEFFIWGLTDPHPWVRRSAIKLFDDNFELLKNTAFSDTIDMHLYPGVLDLIIEGANLSCDNNWHEFINQYIKKYTFTNSETRAINSYLQ